MRQSHLQFQGHKKMRQSHLQCCIRVGVVVTDVADISSVREGHGECGCEVGLALDASCCAGVADEMILVVADI